MAISRTWASACLTVALLASGGAAGAAGDHDAALLAPPGACGPAAERLSLDQATAARTMLCLTNYARRRSGLAPLSANPLLDRAGRRKLAADLACGQFSHSPCGRPFQVVFVAYLHGASRYRIGENIAWATGRLGSPRETMNAWLHSPGHRANILNPGYRDFGIGYLPSRTFQGRTGATLWAQEFGARGSTSAAAPVPAKASHRATVASARTRSSSVTSSQSSPG